MKDEKLVKISLLLAIVGIIGIYLVTLFVGPEFRQIGLISEDDAGRHFTLNGTVLTRTESDGNLFWTVGDETGNITAVMFERTARGTAAYDIKAGQNVSIAGQINVYKGELEIIVNSIQSD